MKRRAFIGLLGGAAAIAWTPGRFAARAQAPAKVWRVGIIVERMRTPAYDGFLEGMHERGYVAGRDYVAEWRFANGRYTRIPVFVNEFIKLKVDVIFLGTPAAINPVREATRTIPVVMGYSTDPVGNGFVASLLRPGGNITGLASSGEDPSARQYELLAAVVPDLSRVGLLLNPERSDYPAALAAAQSAAEKLRLALVWADARSPAGLDKAFKVFASQNVQAVNVPDDPFFYSQYEQLALLAQRHRLPSLFADREFVQAGGLMSYGENIKEFYRRAASFVDRILKGARPGDLPIERPPRQLVINRRVANALGLNLSKQVLALADEVIE